MPDDSQLSARMTPRAEPQSFRGRSLAASLTVKDVRASLAWYRDTVGFTVHQQHEHEGELMAVALKAGDVRIMLHRDDGARGWDRGKGEGFSLMITTAQDVDAIASRIRERGGSLETEPQDMPWGTRAFRVRDPDGFKITISSEIPEHA